MANAGARPLSAAEVADLECRFAGTMPQELLAWGLDHFHPRIALASNFGAEDVVLVDMLWRLNPRARIVTLDTWRLHTETYAVIDAVRQRYGLEVETFYPDVLAVDGMVKQHGYNCFYQSVENRKLCCGIRKVEPLKRALADLDAWITGLRRDQAATRRDTLRIEIDEVHDGIAKLNPLVDWTSDQVWAYIRANDVPYNALHDRGFPSIGCAPCTRAVRPGEEVRAGRWWWEQEVSAQECGIHVGYDPQSSPALAPPVLDLPP